MENSPLSVCHLQPARGDLMSALLDQTPTRMLSRTERIDEFHLKVSRTEKELYEEFLKTEEAEIVLEMQQYFAQARQHACGNRFDNTSLWSKIENRVGVWFAEVCADRNQNENLIRRSKEAILHRMKNLLAKMIRESLGTT